MEKIEVSARDAAPDDLVALTLLINQLGYTTSAGEMKIRFNLISDHPDYKTLVAVVGGEVVGMVGLCKGLFYEMNGMYLRILVLVVKHTDRSRGVGKILIAAAESWAKENGLKAVYINCGNRKERDAAHQFYRHMGYAAKSSGYVKLLN